MALNLDPVQTKYTGASQKLNTACCRLAGSGRLRHQPRLLDTHLQASSLVGTCFPHRAGVLRWKPRDQGLALPPWDK